MVTFETRRPRVDRTPAKPTSESAYQLTIVLLLVAVGVLLALVFTQVLLDNEPYPCTPGYSATNV
jgi:hypothetical protein